MLLSYPGRIFLFCFAIIQPFAISARSYPEVQKRKEKPLFAPALPSASPDVKVSGAAAFSWMFLILGLGGGISTLACCDFCWCKMSGSTFV